LYSAHLKIWQVCIYISYKYKSTLRKHMGEQRYSSTHS
jgi:hypothetical protein